jgi:hypothetical protein
MNRQICKAKALYWISGKLMKIKTPQRMYCYEGLDDNGEAIMSHGEWRWFVCVTSIRFLDWSMDVKGGHWEHWALRYTDEHRVYMTRCEECGGLQVDEKRVKESNGHGTDD